MLLIRAVGWWFTVTQLLEKPGCFFCQDLLTGLQRGGLQVRVSGLGLRFRYSAQV